jgi:hypothetical protein
MSADKARTAKEKRDTAKFYPVDTATFSNVLVALSLIWQIISMLSNTGVSPHPNSFCLVRLIKIDRSDYHLPVETE